MPITFGPDFQFMKVGKEDFELEQYRDGQYLFENGIWKWQT